MAESAVPKGVTHMPSRLPSNDVRRPISLKIFGIAISILLLMIIVTISSSISLYRMGQELNLLSDVYIQLDQKLGDIRAQCLREIITIERVLRTKPKNVSIELDKTTNDQITEYFKEAGDCEPESLRPVIRKIRQVYPDSGARRLITYRLNRLCTTARLESANNLIDQAMTLPQVRAYPNHIERFATIRVEIANILPAQTKLQNSFEKYLKQQTIKNYDALDLMQEKIDESRREVSRGISKVTRTLHEGTRESANRAKNLKVRAMWLGWAVTSFACAAGLILAGFITRNLVRPVRELLSHTEMIRTGNLDVNIQINTADEIALLADSFKHMVGELKQKEMIKKLFGKYVDPRIVKVLMHSKQQLAQSGERQVMSVFFSDIKGFTQICEGLTPSGAVRLLNVYFSLMAESIRDRQGLIDKYIGDSVMAYWGPPFTSSEEHATLACLAALDQQALLPKFHVLLQEVMCRRNVPTFEVRMGISTGDVIVGSIGSEDARSYTVIGDTVNLGSRIESANKYYNTRILICEKTRALAGDAIETREIDIIRFVGKNDPVRVYELIGCRGSTSTKIIELITLYEHGLALYREAKWNEARGAFMGCLKINPDDGPSLVFIERIGVLERQMQTESWDGIWTLTQK
jgi:adenylate cyclase